MIRSVTASLAVLLAVNGERSLRTLSMRFNPLHQAIPIGTLPLPCFCRLSAWVRPFNRA